MQAQKNHKEKVKNYMRGEVPIEETEIGRIDKSLRIIMNKRYLMNKNRGFNFLKPDADAPNFRSSPRSGSDRVDGDMDRVLSPNTDVQIQIS